jgi:hypothetical protein
MPQHFRLYVPVALFSAVLFTSGCSESSELTLSAGFTPANLSVEPNAIHPDFLPAGSGCATHRPFGLRFAVHLNGSGITAWRVRFSFEDRFGKIFAPALALRHGSFPTESAYPTGGPTIPFPSPSTSPNSSPIAAPSSTPLQGFVSSVGTSSPLGVSLQFDCGIVPDGTLIIVADYDMGHNSHSSHARVRVQ